MGICVCVCVCVEGGRVKDVCGYGVCIGSWWMGGCWGGGCSMDMCGWMCIVRRRI